MVYSKSVRVLIVIVSLIVFSVSFPASGTAQAQKPLILGIHPYLASSDLMKRFTPLADYLSRELKIPVKIRISETYDEHVDKIGRDVTDIAYMGPASYVLMTSRYGKKPILGAFQTGAKKTFRGAIVVKRGSTITSIKQLKGKKFAFGDPDSTMSHLVPRYMMLEEGVKVTDLAGYEFLANHDNIAMGILSGSFDAGAIKDETYFQYEASGLKAIAFTPEIADHIFVASSRLSAKTTEALRQALLKLKDRKDGGQILESIKKGLTALVPAEDRDYENLRVILNGLKKAGVKL